MYRIVVIPTTSNIEEWIIIKQQKQTKGRTNLTKLLIVLSIPYIAVSLNNDGFLGLLPFVREEFALTRTQVGFYSSFFFISAAVLAIFTGNVVDRLGPKKGILLGLSCMGVAMFSYGIAPSYFMLMAFAFVAGLGFSIITPSVNKGVILGAPPGKRAVSMGIMQSGIGIGGFAGASLLPVVGSFIGWRYSIQGAALVALAAALSVFLFYHEDGRESEAESEPLPLKEGIAALFANKILLRVCIVGIFFGGVTGAALAHFTVFLADDLGLAAGIAGLSLGMVHIGGIAGRPLLGWLSDSIFDGNRQKTLFSSGLVICLIFIIFATVLQAVASYQIAVLIFSFVLGLTVFSWMGVYFVTVGELAGDEQAGIATGMGTLFTRIGMLVAPPVFGVIADATGTYRTSWLLYAVVILGAAVLFYLSSKNDNTEIAIEE